VSSGEKAALQKAARPKNLILILYNEKQVKIYHFLKKISENRTEI